MLRSVSVGAGNPVNNAGNALIVVSSQGVLTFTFNDGSVLENVVAGDSFDFSIPGQYKDKSALDHYEYFKVDSTVPGDVAVLQIGWGRKYQLPAGGGGPTPPVAVDLWSQKPATSQVLTLAGGTGTGLSTGNPASARSVIVSADPANAGPVFVDSNASSAIGLPLMPGQEVRLYSPSAVIAGSDVIDFFNPNVSSCTVYARWEY